MPVPTLATLYDKKGIPIAVDPRIPAPVGVDPRIPSLSRPAHKPVHEPPLLHIPLDQTLTGSYQNTVKPTTKRNASDDPQVDLNKRVKTDKTSFVLESSAPINAPPPTPVTASHVEPARASHDNFMAECAANGIVLTAAESNFTRQSSSLAPPLPLEAIETLMQVSSDLLLALVRKGATDRERQLQVAVGTLRTCLDVDFTPHMDAWRAAVKAAGESQSTTPLSAVLESMKPHLSIAIPAQSSTYLRFSDDSQLTM